MKKLIIELLIVFTPIIAFLAFVEIVDRSAPNSYKLKEQWMKDHGKDVELLIMGPSNVNYGVRPELFKGLKAFNLANVSESLDYTYWMLTHKTKDCKKLKYIVLSVAYYTFRFPRLEDVEPYRPICYHIYNNCDIHSDFSKYSCEIFMPTLAKNKFIQTITQNTTLTCDSLGFACNYTLANKTPQKAFYENDEAKQFVSYHTRPSSDVVEFYKEYLYKIANYCKENHIKLILITTPVWRTYYNNVDAVQLNELYSIANKFSKDMGLPYKTYLTDGRFSEDDFYDIGHLTDVGAAKFTKILINDFNIH